ncbi:response regulator transcription factor [Miniphocaeibacter halophilus]|uniref:Response regulator transcription factor n=1 Tax=Miniphocaeibacter halophilus TaxID=2931922 RepID=A0AC61MVJ2_9FIRM|nr:response regulator transcription factor [Miniphocaeibacter halophilus]QQK08044.1 response regulator transcription factor [Miniphocaeibacter halophilus]
MDTILIVEDDLKLNDGIRLALKNENYNFIQCYSVESAKNELNSKDIELILLDINLPDGDGLEFLKEIRLVSNIPIILITANNMEIDIVTGLELGANDYITKPFSLMVLRARVDVWLRQNKNNFSSIYKSEDYYFDFRKMIFNVGNNLIELSKNEQKLLKILIDNKNKVVLRERLIDEIWDGDLEYVDSHALTVIVKRLRDKIEISPKHPLNIKTVYGIGYTWSEKK